jgi:2'-hydroxyisoflavone reductase
VQFIDVRDLADWIVRVVEDRTVGTYNATGPGERIGLGDLFEECKEVSGSGADLTWVDAAFLEKHAVRPLSDLPMWSPAGSHPADVSVKKAIGKGLTFRPMATTIQDTLEWWKSLPKARRILKLGLEPEREAKLLKAWHESG